MNATRSIDSLPRFAALLVLAGGMVATLISGCGEKQKPVAGAAAESAAEVATHLAHPEEKAPACTDACADECVDGAAETAEASDLDQPVEALMGARCQHGVPTYQCDECRYEVGFVKVAPDLLDADGPLATARAERRDVDEAAAHNGEVRLNETRSAYLGPRAPGVVQSIRVDLGERVRRGQVLFTVTSVEFVEARSAYRVAQAELRLAEATLERERDLFEKKVCPRRDLLEAEAARDGAAASCVAAKGHLLACGLTEEEINALHGAETEGSAMPVRAPFDGVVLERNLSLGSSVEPGQQLVLVGDVSEMWVWTSLYERELAGLLRAQEEGPVGAEIEVLAYPGRVFRGRVERMSGLVDEATRTARVRVAVDNPEGLLRAGMFARVRLHLGHGADVVAVPADAVLEDEGRSFVFVPAEPPYFVRRPVLAGRSGEGWVEIASGLETGDLVVSRGAFTLKSDVLRSKMGAGCAD